YTIGAVEPSYGAWADRLHPEDRVRTEAVVRSALTGDGTYRHEYRIVRPDGTILRILGHGSLSYDRARRPIRLIGAMIDVTERHHAAASRSMLIGELQHRVRNLLAVVRSIFARTVEAGGPIEDIALHFKGRLDALARTHVIATRNPGATLDLENLLREELLAAGFGSDPRVLLDGPDVALDSRSAEIIGLALHELITNAIKYGAFKFPAARIEIRWSINLRYGSEPHLLFKWMEQGVPMVGVLPGHQGFGSEFIREGLPYRLGAETELVFTGGGARCTISLPLPGNPA
ncbi:sensor histidine kinase, partial [Sphingomonas pokkalii]